MKPIDNLRARAFAALTDDLIEGKGFQRLEALRKISSGQSSANKAGGVSASPAGGDA